MIRITFRRYVGACRSILGLLRPRHVVRTEQAFHHHRKLDRGARVAWHEFLVHRHTEVIRRKTLNSW